MTSLHIDKSGQDPAYRVVVSVIEDMLADGRLLPGEALPNEVDLAARFGVNRSTIREGLRVLEDSGFVSRPSPRKLVAALPTAQVLALRTSRALRVNRVTIRDVWETDLAVEPMMARVAARSATDEQIAQLQTNVDRTQAQFNIGGDLTKLDEEFHLLIGEASNNQALIIAREPIKTLFMPVISGLVERAETGQRMLEAHRHIATAIADRDGDIAALWATRHLEDFARGCALWGIDMDVAISVILPAGHAL